MNGLIIKDLQKKPYQDVWQAMQIFTKNRDKQTADELWLLEHFPVYTQGLAGKDEHLLKRTSIEVIKIDRGGQITYHAPGQLVVYFLWDLNRLKIGVRKMVDVIEQSVISLLFDYSIKANARADAPGVYVADKKIMSLGLKISKGCCYHGLALNVAMDLQPFSFINPCGMKGMQMTQLIDLGVNKSISQVKHDLANKINQTHQQFVNLL